MAFEQLEHDIVCIDAEYIGPGIASLYLVRGGDEYAVIETGTALSVPAVMQCLDALAIDAEAVRYVVPTHIHLDHAGGAGALLEHLPMAEVLVHPRGLKHLVDPGRLLASAEAVYGAESFRRLHGDIQAVPASRIRSLEDGETFRIGRRTLRVSWQRGHAEHHWCIWDDRSRGWFTGDMFGISYPVFRMARGSFVIPATAPTQFDPDAYRASVASIAESRPEWLYLTHFGRLAFDPDLANQLEEQLVAYRSLVHSQIPDEAMAESVIEAGVTSLARRFADADETAIRARMAMDAALNAQGIVDRRQRLAAGSQ
jgi:glyoxylase-like metal-dependent hydrolase (beta-lactamase superfamily II)